MISPSRDSDRPHHVSSGFVPGGVLVASESLIGGKRTSPLADSAYLSLSQFRHEYTSLIPEDVQKRMKAESGGKWYPLAIKNGKLNISETTCDAADVWDLYFRACTSAQESQTDSADAIDYKIDLDLTILCKYGRRISDLYCK